MVMIVAFVVFPVEGMKVWAVGFTVEVAVHDDAKEGVCDSAIFWGGLIMLIVAFLRDGRTFMAFEGWPGRISGHAITEVPSLF